MSLEMRFTEPATPLFIEMEGDALDVLFVISTSQVQRGPSSTQRKSQTINARKREREQSTNETPRIKKPMKAAQAVALDRDLSGKSRAGSYAFGSMPPPSAIGQNRLSNDQADYRQDSHSQTAASFNHVNSRETFHQKIKEEPLFLPSSQISVADEEALKAIGLDADAVDTDQLADLLEGDGEEVDFSYMSQPPAPIERMRNLHFDNYMDMDDHESLDIIEDPQLTATQQSEGADKVFLPPC